MKSKKGNLPYTVEPRLTATPLIQPSCYYGHLILARKKLSQSFSYFKNPFNTTTPLIRPEFCGPLVTGLTGFHCSPYSQSIPSQGIFRHGTQFFRELCLLARWVDVFVEDENSFIAARAVHVSTKIRRHRIGYL